MGRWWLRLLGLVLIGLVFGQAPVRAQLHSYAVVREDASLLVRGQVVRLFGVFVPQVGILCGRTLRPAKCGSRAAVALDFKIQGFVFCRPVIANRDGSISAFCEVNSSRFAAGEDLGAYLIAEGLALASPEAPFAYHALEKIARANAIGVWGFQVDSLRR